MLTTKDRREQIAELRARADRLEIRLDWDLSPERCPCYDCATLKQEFPDCACESGPMDDPDICPNCTFGFCNLAGKPIKWSNFTSAMWSIGDIGSKYVPYRSIRGSNMC